MAKGNRGGRAGTAGGVNPANIKNVQNLISQRERKQAEVDQTLTVLRDMQNQYGGAYCFCIYKSHSKQEAVSCLLFSISGIPSAPRGSPSPSRSSAHAGSHTPPSCFSVGSSAILASSSQTRMIQTLSVYWRQIQPIPDFSLPHPSCSSMIVYAPPYARLITIG